MIRVPCLLFAVACIASGALAHTVPVLMWGPLSKSGPVLNDRSPVDFIETVSSSPMTLVFVEESLTAEDISLCKTGSDGSCFSYLSSVSPKSYYAQVSRPVENVEDSSENLQYLYVDKDGRFDQKIPLKAATVIISLEEDPELDRDENLEKHDAYIKKIYGDVTSKFGADQVLALYTGATSNSLVRRVRQATNNTAAPAAAAATGPQSPSQSPSQATSPSTFTSPSLLVYYSRLVFINDKIASTVDITGMTILNKTDNSFDVTMPTKANTLSFSVFNVAGYWHVNNTKYGSYVLNSATETVGAANGFSYYCGQNSTFTAAPAHQQSLTWVGLQIEPHFSNTTTASSANMARFDDPYNCVGFTSIPIWSVLFISFMMLGILSIGITCMLDINTMDRFDDPKGKTIIINTSE